MTQNYIKENNLQTAMAEYQDNMGEERTLYDQYERELGTVTQAYNNTTGAGEQVYAVVKNPDEEADKVQEVTVLFRGSTGPDHILNEAPDVWNDWAENDAVIAKRIVMQSNPSDRDNSTEQLKASARALKDVMEKYPNAKINIYGHSLGSMDAQYAMAALEAAKSSESNRLISTTDLMSTESLALNRGKLSIRLKDVSTTMLTLKI